MKNTKKILFILLIGLIHTNVLNAQFLKRLNRSVQRSAENAAINTAERIAADKAGEAVEKGITKGLESLYSSIENGNTSVKGVDSSILPDSYEFEWMYTLQMQTNDGLFNIDYFLKPKASYFGAKPNMEQTNSSQIIFMVIDTKLNTNTIFMESGGKKIAMPSSVSVDTDFDSNKVDQSNDFSFKEIGTKKILGYHCQGYQMENDDTKTIIYVTKKAPVSFTNLFSNNSKNMPKGFNPKWLDKLDNSLVMQLEYTNKEDNSITTMNCVLLKKNPFTIKKSDYQFMNISIPTN